jgi:hypothetical protein
MSNGNLCVTILASIKNTFSYIRDNSLKKCCRSRQPAGLAKAVISLLRDDDVIKQPVSEDFAGFADAFG